MGLNFYREDPRSPHMNLKPARVGGSGDGGGNSTKAFCGPACGRQTHCLVLDVLLDPFLFGKGLVANCIVSIDVFAAINPQPSKLGYRRETGHGRTVLLLGFGFRCSLSEYASLRPALAARKCGQ